MATITYLNGKRVFTYSNEHVPAHAHVSSNGFLAKFELNCYSGPVECVKSRGYSDPELNEIRRELAGVLRLCCDHWRNTYGAFT